MPIGLDQIVSMTRGALITAVIGQDSNYMATLLLAMVEGVHGIKRRSSSLNTDRIDHLYQGPS